MKRLLATALTACLALAISTPALAYVDPNAGGLVFQVCTPILAAVAGGFALARRRIGAMFLRARDWLVRRNLSRRRPE